MSVLRVLSWRESVTVKVVRNKTALAKGHFIMPKKKTKEAQEAIIVLGGSFCPPHAGHVAALKRGRAAAERDGLTVVAGYFAVATNGHVRSKLRARGEEPSLIFDAEDRVRMCNAVAETTGWMKPTPGPFGSAQA